MEELLKSMTDDPQGELFRRFCSEAEILIASAATKEEALRIKQDVCSTFEHECGSSLVVQMTRTFADRLIERKWGKL